VGLQVKRLAQAAGWGLLLAIAAVSLVPPELRPTTDFPNYLEHATIFFLAGLALGIGYPSGVLGWILRLTAFTAAIEIAQLWVPGRHARLLDFAVDAFSICMGLAIGASLAKGALRSRTQTKSPV
jgi:VanZ family protein